MSRKNISLTEPIDARAQEIIRRRGFTGLSDMIATLVREEYERRFGVSSANSLALADSIVSDAISGAAQNQHLLP